MASVVMVLAISGLSAPAHGAASADPVSEWNQIAVSTLIVLPGPGGGAPPATQILMAMTQGAVYDAVNAIDPTPYEPYRLTARFSPGASKKAAVATAAYRVLTNVVTTVPASIPFPNKADLLANLDARYAASLASIPNNPSKTEGIAAGDAAAAAMIAARQNDGRFGPSQWVPNTAAGHWWPFTNTDGTLQLDPTPWAGGVRPFLMLSPSQFRTAGPLPLTSTQYAQEFNEVKALGSASSTVRTTDQTHIAIFWQSTPVNTWNEVARTLIADPSYALDLADRARLFAIQNLSAADAAINCWNDKYHWDFWRPWNAIHRAGEDNNAATEADTTWTALITAPYPDHPSGHLCLDGAHLRVLQTFFGTDHIGFDVTSLRFVGETRHFDRFSAALAEITEARIWAGLHFRTADVQAQLLGRNVADYAAENFFHPMG